MLSISIYLPAQKNKSDSLTALLNGNDDTSKVNTLNELTKALWYYQLDKAAGYNNVALRLADSLSYARGFAEANRCRGVILSFRGDSTGIIYLTRALDIFKRLNNKRGIAATLNNQNIFYFNRKQYVEALDVLFQSLDIFTELKDKEAIGAVINEIGNVYSSQANFSAALEYYLKALAIRRQIGDRPGTAFSLNRVGDMYSKLNQLPEAMNYYQQSLKMAHDLDRNQNIMDAAISIGRVYQKQEKYDDALAYFNIGLKAEERYLGKDSVVSSYKYIGQIYYAQKNYSLSLFNFQKALAIVEKKSMIETAGILHSIGKLYFDEGNFPKALENCLRSLDLAKQNKATEIIKDATLTLSQIYASMKEYKKAYDYHLQYIVAKDSILNEDLNQKLAAVKQSFEIKDRQTQIDLLNSDKQLQQSELNRQKQQRYALIIGIFLFLLVAVVLARSNRHKQKTNYLITKQKQQVETTLSELKSTQAQLIQSEKMASLGELTAGIAHEIQNPLNFVNNFSEVSNELINEMNEELKKGDIEEARAISKDIKQNLEKINHHGKRADSIVKGMLQHSRTSTGQKEPIDINALCDEYLRLGYHGFRTSKGKDFNVTIQTDFDKSVNEVNIIRQDIGRVLLNLYNNAFYAVNEKKQQQAEGYRPKILVSTKKMPGKVEIKIKDNGNGIPQKVLGKIYQPFFTTKPTGQGTGLGLSLSYDIIAAHGGAITAETKENEGAEFKITLPIN